MYTFVYFTCIFWYILVYFSIFLCNFVYYTCIFWYILVYSCVLLFISQYIFTFIVINDPMFTILESQMAFCTFVMPLICHQMRFFYSILLPSYYKGWGCEVNTCKEDMNILKCTKIYSNRQKYTRI